jgi:hypothetical protein
VYSPYNGLAQSRCTISEQRTNTTSYGQQLHVLPILQCAWLEPRFLAPLDHLGQRLIVPGQHESQLVLQSEALGLVMFLLVAQAV